MFFMESLHIFRKCSSKLHKLLVKLLSELEINIKLNGKLMVFYKNWVEIKSRDKNSGKNKYNSGRIEFIELSSIIPMP